WLRPAGYGRPGIGIFTALAAGTIAAGFMVVSLLQTRVLTPAPALRPVVVAASPPAPVLAHAPRTTSGTIVGIGAPVLVDDTIMGADASGGPWGQLTDPAFAASVTGMPVWAAAVLAAHSPPGFPTPRLKLTNLER